MVLIFLAMAIFGWQWKIAGVNMGIVGVVLTVAYVVVWNVRRSQQSTRLPEPVARPTEGFPPNPGVPRAQCVASAIDRRIGRWEGIADAHPQGLRFFGEHTFLDPDPAREGSSPDYPHYPDDFVEKTEPADLKLDWKDLQSFSDEPDGSLRLQTPFPARLKLTLTDFPDDSRSDWLRIMKEGGVYQVPDNRT